MVTSDIRNKLHMRFVKILIIYWAREINRIYDKMKVKLFLNFMIILFDNVLIKWVTTYTYNPGFLLVYCVEKFCVKHCHGNFVISHVKLLINEHWNFMPKLRSNFSPMISKSLTPGLNPKTYIKQSKRAKKGNKLDKVNQMRHLHCKFISSIMYATH